MSNTSADFVDFNQSDIWRAVKQNEFQQESQFVHDAIKKYHPTANTIIDIGCGSGDHNYYLEQKGYETLGVDLNTNMVEFAKDLFPDQAFEIGDMQTYRSEKKFDVLMCLCTTFCHNISNDEVDRTLQNFNTLTAQDGLLIIDVFNPISFLARGGMPMEFDYNPEAYAIHNLNAIVTMKLNQDMQTVECIRTIKNINTKEVQAREEYSFRLFFPQELAYFLEQNGFSFISFFGEFDINQEKLSQNRLIAVAKKK